MRSKREEILVTLGTSHVPLTLHFIMREVEAGPVPCRRHLHALMAEGLVVRSGTGQVGRPYCYALPSWYTERGKPPPGGGEGDED